MGRCFLGSHAASARRGRPRNGCAQSNGCAPFAEWRKSRLVSRLTRSNRGRRHRPCLENARRRARGLVLRCIILQFLLDSESDKRFVLDNEDEASAEGGAWHCTSGAANAIYRERYRFP